MRAIITAQDLEYLEALTRDLLGMGDAIMQQSGQIDLDGLIRLLAKREQVYEKIHPFSALKFDSIVEGTADPRVQELVISLRRVAMAVVEQNLTLQRCIQDEQKHLTMQMAKVDHALGMVERYYPVSADHGRGQRFDTKL